jgi:hypothetical protein
LGLLLTAVLVFLAVEWAMLNPRIRHHRDPPPQECLAAWNSPSNGVVRKALNAQAQKWAGTPLLRMRLERRKGECILAAVLGDGSAEMWTMRGPIYTARRLRPTSADYPEAARALTESNVTLQVRLGGSLLNEPDMGTLTVL